MNPYSGANVRRVISADATPAGIPPTGDRCPPGRIRSHRPGPERRPVRARHTGPHGCMSRRGWNAVRGRCRYGSHTRSAAPGCRQGPHPVRLSGLPAPEYPAVRRASVSFSAAPAGPSGRIPAALPPAPARSLPFPAIRRRGAGTKRSPLSGPLRALQSPTPVHHPIPVSAFRGRRGPGWPGSASRAPAGPFSSPAS